MTVKDFISRNQGIEIVMMTPGGYVYLSEEKALDLLVGGSVWGHPGYHESGHTIEAEELLPQEVLESNYSGGAWHLLTDYQQEECLVMEDEEFGMVMS